jgi:hypothetical protein
MPSGPKLPETRLRPLPADLSVRAARDAYLEENGFSVETYDARWTDATLLGMKFKIPNTARHRSAIMLHDLHHAATGYGTDLFGEVEVSAWECRRGVRPLGLYVASIVVGLALFGVLIAPRRTWRAWCAGAGRGSLFHREEGYEAILGLSLGALRERLGIPKAGLHRGPRMLVAGAPGARETESALDEAPSSAIALLIEVAVLLGGLAIYLLVSDTGSGRDDGYAFVVAIHLAILATVCVAASVRLAARRGSGS